MGVATAKNRTKTGKYRALRPSDLVKPDMGAIREELRQRQSAREKREQKEIDRQTGVVVLKNVRP
jgi:hypothetical protein